MNAKFRKNNAGIATIIETVIASAIIFTILALFYSSINSMLYIHVRYDIDLESKCQDVMETIIRLTTGGRTLLVPTRLPRRPSIM